VIEGIKKTFSLKMRRSSWMRFSVYDVPTSGNVKETGEYKTILGKECTAGDFASQICTKRKKVTQNTKHDFWKFFLPDLSCIL